MNSSSGSFVVIFCIGVILGIGLYTGEAALKRSLEKYYGIDYDVMKATKAE